MRTVRSITEPTADELKAEIAQVQASLEEYARLGELDQARAAYDVRDDLLLELAARLAKDEEQAA